MEASFLRELFYNNAYSTDNAGRRYYTVEAFSNVYTVVVEYHPYADHYRVLSWKNESL